MALLRLLWNLSTTETNSNEARQVLLEGILSANISPEVLVATVHSPEYQHILHAERRFDPRIGSFCWFNGRGLYTDDVLFKFLDALRMLGERSTTNELNNRHEQASSSQSTSNASDKNGCTLKNRFVNNFIL